MKFETRFSVGDTVYRPVAVFGNDRFAVDRARVVGIEVDKDGKINYAIEMRIPHHERATEKEKDLCATFDEAIEEITKKYHSFWKGFGEKK